MCTYILENKITMLDTVKSMIALSKGAWNWMKDVREQYDHNNRDKIDLVSPTQTSKQQNCMNIKIAI